MARSISRRRFLAVSAATAAAAATPNAVWSNKSGSQVILGEGEHRYEVHHDWAKLPKPFTWQTTHNVAVDAEQRLYVIHEGREELKDHPSIFVFDQQGKLIRSFGSQFQGGGHGIEVRREGSQEFLYVCAYQQVKAFAKLTLEGEVVWLQHAPMESGVYAEGEDTKPERKWGPDRFLPTNFAFLDDGGFLLADGYGSYYIHRFDKEGKWQSCFGGPGEGNGKFKTPHGIWIDRRDDEPRVVICDRAHNTLQHLTLDGKHLATQEGFGLPANVDSRGELLLVPELKARITLLGKDNQVVAQLGMDVDKVNANKGLRTRPQDWEDGRFVHPHDACFGAEGDIYVAEWVATGRISRLKRLG
ncbi:MAG: twin-arginine translocation signal domain-containing protein [Planctomycetales bacterium]|nr:twin-arginine translocation signal domain-containing protein [Planctomycetales bacterium]